MKAQKSSGKLPYLGEQLPDARMSVLIFRKAYQGLGWLNMEFVAEFCCKLTAQDVEAQTDYKRGIYK